MHAAQKVYENREPLREHGCSRYAIEIDESHLNGKRKYNRGKTN